MVKHQKRFVRLEDALRLFVDEIVETAEKGPAYFLFTQEDLLEAILERARIEGVTLTCGKVLLVDGHFLTDDPSTDLEEEVGAKFGEMFDRLARKRRGLVWQNQILEDVLVAGSPE